MTKLLEVKNIETYYDLVYAIRGASFSVEEGSITTILGTNGAGKSTILKTIMSLIDDQPDKGSHRQRAISGRYLLEENGVKGKYHNRRQHQ